MLWSYRYPGLGNLDYGNSPRATPVIAGKHVYLYGAFGNLACVELSSGKPVWEMNVLAEFEPAEKSKWGTCSTPLLVDDRLIVNPGAKDASLVALEAKTGKVLWKTPGAPAGHGSFIAGTFGGVMQVVGHDVDSLGGWDPQTGRQLWRLKPDHPNDFNVPTPIAVDGKLLVATENNGTRLYAFDAEGKINPKPAATNKRLAPDTQTPVVTAGRVFGVSRRLFCLDLANGLKEVWTAADAAYANHCTLVADATRVLIITLQGELILLDAKAAKYTELARMRLFDEEKGLYAHPAFVGRHMYVRGSRSIVRVGL